MIIATGVSYRDLDAPGVADALRPRRLLRLGRDRGRATASTTTSTSSAAPTRPARPRCSSPAYGQVGDAGRARRLPRARACRTTSSSSCRRSTTSSVRLVHRRRRGARRRPPRGADAAATSRRAPPSASTPATLFVFIGAQPRTDWLAGVLERDEPRLRAHRARTCSLDGERPRGWTARPRPVAAGVERPRRLRRRRRARRLGEAGRVRGRRGRDGRHPRPPLPGGAMTDDRRPVGRLTPRRAAAAVPLRGARRRAARLAGRARLGRRAARRRRSSLAEGEPAEVCRRCCSSARSSMSRRVGQDDVEIVRTDQVGVYAGAMQSYIDDRRAADLHRDGASGQRRPAVRASAATTSPRRCATWFPMAIHLLEGLFLGMRNSQQIVGQRQQLLALGALSAGPDARAEQPGRGGRPGQRRRCAMRVAGHAAQARDARARRDRPAAARAARRRAGGGRAGRRDAPRADGAARSPSARTSSATGSTSTASPAPGSSRRSSSRPAPTTDFLDKLADERAAGAARRRDALAGLHPRDRAAARRDHRLGHPDLVAGGGGQAVLAHGPRAVRAGRHPRRASRARW